MKRKLLVLSVLAICLAILTAGTLAYFTVESTAHNVITTGGADIALLEWADAEKTQPFENLTGVMPNTSVTKIAEVKNTGNSSLWVRVKIEKDIEPAQGVSAPLDPDMLELDINSADWVDGGDGYLYYNSALLPGETTTPVFTTVTFKAGMGNDYKKATATVDVTAQAVQTANNGSSAQTAAGWPA